MKNFINNYIKDSLSIQTMLLHDPKLLDTLQQVAQLVITTYQQQNKIFIAGNGGSAAEAQHLASELVAKFYHHRPALSALALSSNSAILTSISNDYGYEHLFARQVQAYGKAGDLLMILSTSGHSKNIIKAVEEATTNKLVTVGLLGKQPSCLDNLCTLAIKIPSFDPPKIQEAHLVLGHIICALVEQHFFHKVPHANSC